MRIKEYNLKIGATQVYAPIHKILSVQAVGEKIKLWVEVDSKHRKNYFIFFTVENDVNLKQIPNFQYAKYMNTVIFKDKPLHIYCFHATDKAFLSKDIEERMRVFQEAIEGTLFKEDN